MTPDRLEDLLRARRAPPPDDAARERALAAARERWNPRAPIGWHWRLAIAAAALVALDLGITAWASGSSRSMAPALPPSAARAESVSAANGTPTAFALHRQPPYGSLP